MSINGVIFSILIETAFSIRSNNPLKEKPAYSGFILLCNWQIKAGFKKPSQIVISCN